jgi:hypothetical protein
MNPSAGAFYRLDEDHIESSIPMNVLKTNQAEAVEDLDLIAIENKSASSPVKDSSSFSKPAKKDSKKVDIVIHSFMV